MFVAKDECLPMQVCLPRVTERYIVRARGFTLFPGRLFSAQPCSAYVFCLCRFYPCALLWTPKFMWRSTNVARVDRVLEALKLGVHFLLGSRVEEGGRSDLLSASCRLH